MCLLTTQLECENFTIVNWHWSPTSSNLAENHKKGNIFALAWLCLVASSSLCEWNQLNAEILQIAIFLLFCESQLFHEATFLHPSYWCYPFLCFKKKTYAMTKKPKISESRCLQGVKSTQSVKWYWDRAHCQRQSAIFLRKANYDWIGCAIYLHSNNKFALSQVNKVKIQYFCF